MPRVFLIKKKTYGLSASSTVITKKKSNSVISGTTLQKVCNRKEPSYDSESESGRSSTSSQQIPSPSPSPNPPLIPASAAALLSGSNFVADFYSRTTSSILEPLNLNTTSSTPARPVAVSSHAAALPWMKPFLAPYLPFNFPYHPAAHFARHPSSLRSDSPYNHHSSSGTGSSHVFATSADSAAPSPSSTTSSPTAPHRIFHPHHGVSIPRGTLYPSRSEPPSPSCPCPLSPYTPPRDGTPTLEGAPPACLKDHRHHPKSDNENDGAMRALDFSEATGRRMAYQRMDRSSPPTYWSEQDHCSNGSSVQNDSLSCGSPVDVDDDGNRTVTVIGRDVEDDDYGLQHRFVQYATGGTAVPSSAGGGSAASSRRRTADSGPRYQCPDCNKSYSTYSGLSKHQQFHCATINKKSFSCKYCEKVYMSLGALKMHIRTHTLPCKCKLCGKAFSRPWLLQGHIRTHTGEKPFACPHCNRAFADRSNLRAHLQTHSDVKKYSCKTCAKTFSRMSLLSKHEDGGCVANVTLIQETFVEP